jgi:hypothetical protein
MRVESGFPVFSDAVFPMVMIGAAPAGPAQGRDTRFLTALYYIKPYAANVGNIRIRPHPYSVVNHLSKILEK